MNDRKSVRVFCCTGHVPGPGGLRRGELNRRGEALVSGETLCLSSTGETFEDPFDF